MNTILRAAKRSICGDEYISINVTRLNHSLKPYLWTTAVWMAVRALMYITEGK